MAGGRGWTRTRIGAGVGLLAAGAVIATVLSPDIVIDKVLWKHFWGPIVADAAGGPMVRNGVTATAGYTPISIVTYAVLLVTAVIGIERQLRRHRLGTERGMVVAFVPFIIGAGVLRVGADVGVGAGTGLQYLFISPLLYVTMGVLAGTGLVAGWFGEHHSLVSDYRRGIVGAGTVFLTAVAAILLQIVTATEPGAAGAILGIATVVTGMAAGIAWASDLFRLQALTATETGTILFGHVLDGSSTAVAVSMLPYGEKQPLVDWFITLTGSPYAFIGLKLGVIAAVLYALNQTDRSDDPTFYNLVLLAILAVGLGPGVRNTTRVLFGV